MNTSGIITFTTDFGLKDSYAGALKGAVLSINPGAVLVDISHQVTSGNITEGAFVLSGAYAFFPPGTVHVAVVDPGVGGERRAILVETENHLFVGPDNGLLMPAAGEDGIRSIIELTERRYFLERISSTFHGRDIFGPVGAHLGLGIPPASFGDPVEDPVTLDLPEPASAGGTVTGEVLYADSFGNLITNIRREDLTDELGEGAFEGVEVSIRGRTIAGIVTTYGSVEAGGFAALIGSSGFLEVAVNGGSARRLLGAGPGEAVTVRGKKG